MMYDDEVRRTYDGRRRTYEGTYVDVLTYEDYERTTDDVHTQVRTKVCRTHERMYDV